MKVSQLYAPTLRETPAEAEIISHQLLLRAGFIRKSTNGTYTYLPLAWRVIKKIEQIVREEMDAKGGQELAMPVIQPAAIWQETGRWDLYGAEMFRLKDRHDRDFCLGPTHEELITTLVKTDVRSYRQLPQLLYQIQNKYRDEIRPRFGLMRSREFIMKDLYSFDKDAQGLNESYNKMYDAYTKVFTRCGLSFRPVEADSGAIGGSGSHEFMALAESGEAAIVYCPKCEYAANVEKAELKALKGEAEEALPLTEVETPNTKSIAAVSAFLKVEPMKTVKTIVYLTDDGKLVLALVRGDHEVNEIKLLNKLGCMEIKMAEAEDIAKFMAASPGYLGPVGAARPNVVLVADATVMNLTNVVCGANKADYHYLNVNPNRDFTPDLVADIRLMQKGDPCPRCASPVESARGIEVGQVFKLHTKYSLALGALFIAENGKEMPMVMGCYGIGIGRTMAAVIEQSYDENGIIWPEAIAPYQVVVVPVNIKDTAQMELAEKIYQDLNALGVETVLDERNERPGVKFKDADLIGYPLRITVGPKAAAENTVEVKERRTGTVHYFSLAECRLKIKELLVK
ncbi:MAG: proline--tRNA ligase [Sporomusaceae bacterium]|jgi:prolyl-tRNA synthetase|nr:proline--tRNA ligase [Sporomusaceae bacterium]